MTSRHPRLPTDLVATIDETEPVRTDPLSLEAVDMANTEWARRLEARIAALEVGAKRKSVLRVWAERVLSALGGSAAVAIAWVMMKAEASGDAKATAREREAERRHLIDTVRALDRRDALQQGQIDALIDRLRYPMQGPPVAPRTDP